MYIPPADYVLPYITRNVLVKGTVVALLCKPELLVENIVTELGSLIAIGLREF